MECRGSFGFCFVEGSVLDERGSCELLGVDIVVGDGYFVLVRGVWY